MDEIKAGLSPPAHSSIPKKAEPAEAKQQAVKVSESVELSQLKLQQAQQEASADRVAGHQQSSESSKSDVKEAVQRLNDYVQSVQRDLHFNYDEANQLWVCDAGEKEGLVTMFNRLATEQAGEVVSLAF